jgi:hypothetical protein
VSRDAAFVDAVICSLECAAFSKTEEPWRDRALAALEPIGRQALGVDAANDDDRSSIYELLVKAREARGDGAGAREVAQEWLAFVSSRMTAATSLEERTAFDGHLVEAAIASKQASRACRPWRRPSVTCRRTTTHPRAWHVLRARSLLGRARGIRSGAVEGRRPAQAEAHGRPRRHLRGVGGPVGRPIDARRGARHRSGASPDAPQGQGHRTRAGSAGEAAVTFHDRRGVAMATRELA